MSKDTRFKVGITTQDLTRNEEIIEETDNDGLMLKKVTYRWYNLIVEKMKETMDHIKDIKPLPSLIMYGTEDKIVDTDVIIELKDKLATNELYLNLGKGYIMKFKMNPKETK